MSTDDVTSALQDLAETLQTQATLGGALSGLAEAATTSVPGCDAATIAISIQGRPATAAITARIALELDMVQYDLQDGPCLTTFATMSAIRLDLTEANEPFPHFAIAARNRGVRGVLSVPATWGNDLVATMNLYSQTGPFDETAVTVAKVLAAQVAIAVSRSPEFASARGVVEAAQRDAEDQADIGLATGLLRVSQACTVEQAEGLLREAAAHDEQTILEIAQRIIQEHKTSQ